jgi:hypothetical protein
MLWRNLEKKILEDLGDSLNRKNTVEVFGKTENLRSVQL